jgi:Protein of unknown function (DUF1631)
MKPNPLHRLPATLEVAVQRLKLCAREAVERTVESLGLAALAATQAYQRDALLAAQFELNRKSAVFALTFNDTFDERIQRELGPRAAPAGSSSGAAASSQLEFRPTASSNPTSWDTLTLVEDREVEAQITAERFGMEIAHACEWELRELDAYVATVLVDAGGERERNPLRPELLGHALLRAVDAVSDRADVRKTLGSELSRSLSALLRSTYGTLVTDFRNAGVQPLGLAVRHRPMASGAGGQDTGYGSGGPGGAGARRGGGAGSGGPGGSPGGGFGGGFGGGGGGGSGAGGGGFSPSGHAGPSGMGMGMGMGGHSGHAGFGGPSTRGGGPAVAGYGRGSGGVGTLGAMGQVDPALMTLIRRLTHSDPVPTGPSGYGDSRSGMHGVGPSDTGSPSSSMPPMANLIHAHRDELRQASRGSLDHMVIDVIGFLFDQILADPKVPPQMARQIARLQLPVLRAALGDSSFFSSRRHPVRRFVNRIATLGAAFEDFDEEAAKSFLSKVRALVQEVVEGDFEQIEVYEQKLAALEAFVAEQARREVQEQGNAAELLQEKEDELRLKQLYAERLAGELKDVAGPAFVRDFVSRVWSQVILRAQAKDGPKSEQAQRLRHVGRELMLSVQPKATPAHRKQFLADLPKLMQDLTEGMNLISWPDAERRAFFARLMPAHAEALKSAAVRQLDLNLMAKHVEGALARSTPTREEVKALAHLPVLQDAIDPNIISKEEAERVGLVDEATFNWDGKIDIDLTAQDNLPVLSNEAPAPGLPALSDTPEVVQGPALAGAVQIGFAYQMYLDDKWQKVRLQHVSPGRTFFIFTQGGRHKKTVSLTQRMLLRLCETSRFKAYEQATLLERATERARRQLAALRPKTLH